MTKENDAQGGNQHMYFTAANQQKDSTSVSLPVLNLARRRWYRWILRQVIRVEKRKLIEWSQVTLKGHNFASFEARGTPIVLAMDSALYFTYGTTYGAICRAFIISCVALFMTVLDYDWDGRYITYRIAENAIWWNVTLLIFYLFHIVEWFYATLWLTVEIASLIVFSALYLVAGVAALVSFIRKWEHHEFFLFLLLANFGLMFIFGYDAYLKLQSVKSRQIPQPV